MPLFRENLDFSFDLSADWLFCLIASFKDFRFGSSGGISSCFITGSVADFWFLSTAVSLAVRVAGAVCCRVSVLLFEEMLALLVDFRLVRVPSLDCMVVLLDALVRVSVPSCSSEATRELGDAIPL